VLESNDEKEEGEEETVEHLEVLVVDAVEPFRVEYEVMYAHSSFPPSSSGTSTGWAGLADLKTFDASWWDERGRGAGEVVVCGRVAVGGLVGDAEESSEGRRETVSERVVVVESIELERVVFVFLFFCQGVLLMYPHRTGDARRFWIRMLTLMLLFKIYILLVSYYTSCSR
jgi:hypothetical protein